MTEILCPSCFRSVRTLRNQIWDVNGLIVECRSCNKRFCVAIMEIPKMEGDE